MNDEQVINLFILKIEDKNSVYHSSLLNRLLEIAGMLQVFPEGWFTLSKDELLPIISNAKANISRKKFKVIKGSFCPMNQTS